MKLDETFLEPYKTREVEFGPVGYVTYKRTYSRDGEEWWETCRRVVEGTYLWQKRHCVGDANRPWSDAKAQHSMQRMYDLIFTMKFLPPGRGLFTMGVPGLLEKAGAAANNCGFTSTKDPVSAFCWAMDHLMLGVGVGFDTAGAGTVLTAPNYRKALVTFHVGDSRAGWVDALRTLLLSYGGLSWVDDQHPVYFDYSQVRPKGAPVGFGGTASGPDPLEEMLEDVRAILDKAARYGGKLMSTDIVDIMNLIGRCIVSGNIRRSAEIAFGTPEDTHFLTLKDKHLHPKENAHHRWAANHSVICEPGATDYEAICEAMSGVDELGIFWQKNAQDYSRMGDAPDYADRRAIASNPCVPGQTRILTREHGYESIELLVGQPVHVWNGFEWSKTTPRVTGYNQPMRHVRLSDGTNLRCTDYHEFYTTDGMVEARHLQVGQKMEKVSMPVLEGGGELPWDAYTAGFYCGDGQGYGSKQGILLYGEAKQACGARMVGRLSPNKLKGDRQWVGLSGCNIPTDKTFVPVNATLPERLDWLAGLLDSDGTVLQNPNSQMLQVTSVSSEFLSTVRLMLTTLGVRAKVTAGQPEEWRTIKGERYYCNATYRLLINASDTWRLQQLGLTCSRLKLTGGKPQRDARRFVTVAEVSDDGVCETVYCFTEKHRNLGTFEGIVTGQCAEQTLEDKELCCLVEVFPSRCESYYEFQEVLKYAYLYAKSVTLIPVHDPHTQSVVARNRRIGCSLTGIQQAKQRHTDFISWCERGYSYLRSLDDRYSTWFGIPRSIKLTSVKPSGTVSKLPGVTSGIHFPPAEHYWQAIRFASDSPLVEAHRTAGYRCADLAPGEPNTTAVYFPVSEQYFSRAECDVSMWEQALQAVELQRYWADNQVSITVKHMAAEAHDIPRLLRLVERDLKAISFFPTSEHSFEHAPWQPTTKEELDVYRAKLKPLVLGGDTHEVTDAFCSGETCMLPNKGDE